MRRQRDLSSWGWNREQTQCSPLLESQRARDEQTCDQQSRDMCFVSQILVKLAAGQPTFSEDLGGKSSN